MYRKGDLVKITVDEDDIDSNFPLELFEYDGATGTVIGRGYLQGEEIFILENQDGNLFPFNFKSEWLTLIADAELVQIDALLDDVLSVGVEQALDLSDPFVVDLLEKMDAVATLGLAILYPEEDEEIG